SLEDITEQVAIVQNSLAESPIILSDSTVSLISMNDGHNVKLLDQTTGNDENALGAAGPSRKSHLSPFQPIRRRVSLQELPTNIVFESKGPPDKQTDC